MKTVSPIRHRRVKPFPSHPTTCHLFRQWLVAFSKDNNRSRSSDWHRLYSRYSAVVFLLLHQLRQQLFKPTTKIELFFPFFLWWRRQFKKWFTCYYYYYHLFNCVGFFLFLLFAHTENRQHGRNCNNNIIILFLWLLSDRSFPSWWLGLIYNYIQNGKCHFVINNSVVINFFVINNNVNNNSLNCNYNSEHRRVVITHSHHNYIV